MKRRLHLAILEASELRAFIVLMLVIVLHAWRWLQAVWDFLPDMLDVMIEHSRRRLQIWLTYYLYHYVHWVKG